MNVKKSGVVLALLLASGACRIAAPYDAISYKNATDLKAQSRLLIKKSNMSAGNHQTKIDDLRLKLHQALEYERGKGRPNAETVRLWEILVDPDGNMMGGFLKLWEEKRTVSPAFAREFETVSAEAFDKIIELEHEKVRD